MTVRPIAAIPLLLLLTGFTACNERLTECGVTPGLLVQPRESCATDRKALPGCVRGVKVDLKCRLEL